MIVVTPVFTLERAEHWRSHLVDHPMPDGWLSHRRGDMVRALCGYAPTGGWDRQYGERTAECKRCLKIAAGRGLDSPSAGTLH